MSDVGEDAQFFHGSLNKAMGGLRQGLSGLMQSVVQEGSKAAGEKKQSKEADKAMKKGSSQKKGHGKQQAQEDDWCM